MSRRHVAVRGGRAPAIWHLRSVNGLKINGFEVPKDQIVPVDPRQAVSVGPYTLHIAAAPTWAANTGVNSRAQITVADPAAQPQPDGVLLRVAQSDTTVLIQGESGVGKDVLAKTIHRASGRNGPLLELNCASLSESLLEGELFGYERGAFTGAVQAKPGLLETAAGGTVFLDEIGDLPANSQAKLLKVLESRQSMRLGGRHPINLDVRFLAATHRDLPGDVAAKRFRQDLYFRINGITLVIQPLRARVDAILPLAQQFLDTAAVLRGGRRRHLTNSAVAVLQRHPWPGNVRELKQVIERALLICGGDEIRPEHLVMEPVFAEGSSPVPRVATVHELASPPPGHVPLPMPTTVPITAEQAMMLEALQQAGGNQRKAAALLGWSLSQLTNKLRLYRIARPGSV